MYPLSYQYSMDIDWFYIDDPFPIHAASNGGLIKRELYTVPQLQEVQRLIQTLPMNYDFELNIDGIIANMSDKYDEEIVNQLLENRDILLPRDFELPVSRYSNEPRWLQFYSHSFIQMAMRGFYSFDRNEDTNEYFLVAKPVIKLSQQTLDLIESLPVSDERRLILRIAEFNRLVYFTVLPYDIINRLPCRNAYPDILTRVVNIDTDFVRMISDSVTR